MDVRRWGVVWAAFIVAGCPGPEVVPAVDGGAFDASVAPPVDAPVGPSIDAPIDPTVDAPIAPGTDAPVATDAPPPSGYVLTGPCTTDADCDDGVDCTVDVCNGGFGCSPGFPCLCRHTQMGSLCGPTETCHEHLGCVPGTACARTADCADTDACTTAEACDTTRRICTSRILDGDGDGDAAPICGGTDCDDTRMQIRPGLAESCDGVDNDCDTIVDEGASAGCGPDGICVSGRCDCPDASETLCDEYDDVLGTYVYRCRDTQTDSDNCGTCGRSCGSTATCVGGSCACDVPGLTFCGIDDCVDTTSDWLNCGVSCRYCGTTSNCVAGACSPCGASGQPCCTDAGVRSECRSGLTCNSGGTCGACGGAGQPCCGGSTCNASYACSAGTCRTCGAAGEPCCAGGTCDLSTLACGTSSTCALRTCALPYDPVPASYLPRCARATLTCIRACTTTACINACIAADTTAEYMGVDCGDCLDLQYLACLDDAGCGDEWAAFECCYADNCPAGSPASCSTPCNAAQTTWNTCASSSGCYIDAGFALQCYAP